MHYQISFESDCCENATEYLPNNKGTINWPRSLVNATVMQTCPKVKGGHEFQTRKVLRKCELDSTNGAQWQKSNMRMCIQRDTASVQELANVSTEIVMLNFDCTPRWISPVGGLVTGRYVPLRTQT